MLNLLIKLFVKDNENIKNSKVRENYGKLSSIVGIALNMILFATKFTVGTLSGSVSITGDAVNNLSDAGSSVISLISFKWSSMPADDKHPFGHARIEYIASSIVAFIILYIGLMLIQTSYDKILRPSEIEFSIIALGVLTFSIAAKLWLFSVNRKLGKRIDSSIMRATAADSLSDVMATSAVLLSMIISPIIHFQLDGYMGIVVAVFIILSGIKILKETLNRILGQAPSQELTELIDSYIRNYVGVMGLHDLVVHEYGANRCFASIHVEVDSSVDIMESHELVDIIERDIITDYGIHLVIHMDPIVKDDPFVDEIRRWTEKVVKSVDDTLTIHDFRVVKGATQNKLIFDVVVPYKCKKDDNKIIDEIANRINEENNTMFAVITIDRSYVTLSNHKTIKE